MRFATEIKEIDINPLLADERDVVAVDARILIEK
ncbi:MAG: acetate--CoA ligase family protein [Prevotella sp.]|nr:acetate--CoA ligase family protein [Prevotella sp.]